MKKRQTSKTHHVYAVSPFEPTTIALAVYVTRAKRVTDEMFIEAATATADQVTDEQREKGLLFPPQSNVLETEVTTAERVAALVFERNLARVDKPKDISAWLRAMLYKPEYKDYRP